MSTRSRRYPPELKERAVRMVFEHQGEYPSQWRAIRQLGVHHESLRIRVRGAETDAGQRPGLTSDEREGMAELEREVRELRRAKEILKSASVFFATELDGRTRK